MEVWLVWKFSEVDTGLSLFSILYLKIKVHINSMEVGPVETSCVWYWKIFIYIRVVHHLKSELRSSSFLFSVVEKSLGIGFIGFCPTWKRVITIFLRVCVKLFAHGFVVEHRLTLLIQFQKGNMQICNELKLQQYPKWQRTKNYLLKWKYATEPCIPGRPYWKAILAVNLRV